MSSLSAAESGTGEKILGALPWGTDVRRHDDQYDILVCADCTVGPTQASCHSQRCGVFDNAAA